MQTNVTFTPPAEVQADWLIVCVFEEDALPTPTAALDAALKGALSRLRQSGDITGKAGELVQLLDVTGIAARRVLVTGLGKRAEADHAAVVDAAATAARAVTGKQLDRLALLLPDTVAGLGAETLALAAGVGLSQGSHGPGLRRTRPDRFTPREFCLVAPAGAGEAEVRRGAQRAAVEGAAVELARELVNTPPCDLYPETFAERARHVAQAAGLECAVLG